MEQNNVATVLDGTTASEPAGSLQQLTDLLQAGGPVVAILLAMSVAALAITLLKLWQFHAVRIARTGQAMTALRLLRDGQHERARQVVEGSLNPLAQVIALALRGLRRSDIPEAKVREEVTRHGADLLEALRSYLRPLEVIASLAPLLGLFGTVLGMIGAFQQLEQAGSQVNPAVLSGGIWEALLTTAVGLAVAIPTVALLHWLERTVDRLAQQMDSAISQIFTEDLSTPQQSARNNQHAGARDTVLAAG